MANHASALPAAVAAAASVHWAERARAGEQLARWADQQDAITALRTLLLDGADTAVTDATCAALLKRGDSRGVRLVAHAVATAPDAEYLDHIYGQVASHLLPDGPINLFVAICNDLAADQDQAVASGARKLLEWARPWSASDDAR